MKIVLSKPIPAEGRIPTAAEIEQFRKQNISPTRSGAWKVCWNTRKDGIDEPCISYFDKRTRSGAGYIFEVVTPTPKPIKTRPAPAKVAIPLMLSENGPEPSTWFW